MGRHNVFFFLALLVCLGIFSAQAAAEDFACGDSAGLTRYIPSIDPSKVQDGTCTVISKANTPTQRVLIAATPLRYLKVVDGLAVEKTQGEKDAVDAAITAAQAARQALLDEIATQDVCAAATLGELAIIIDTFYDAEVAAMTTDITAVTNIATAKAALVTVATQISQQRVVIKKLAWCLHARTRIRG